MILNVCHSDLFNTVLQYVTLKAFKIVFECQAYNVDNIPCPSHSGLVSAALIWLGE